MEEFTKVRVLGFFNVAISIILTFIVRGGSFLFSLISGIFNILVAFLFVNDSDGDKFKKNVKTGFILGIIIWTSLLIGSIYNIVWNRVQTLSNTIFYVILLINTSKDIRQTFTFYWLIFLNYSRFQTLFNSIFRILLIISQYLSGSLAFYIMKRTEVHSEVEREVEREEAYLIPIRESPIEKDLDNTCPNCFEVIQTGAKFCVHCGLKLITCEICQNYINSEETTAICPFCGTILHKAEFLEWIKVKASCPICKNEIDLWEFQKLEK
ncbi:MAG: zinc ribbon domain-containing protein [Candidatus Helarchaeota archaeon]|nr:zinc ribbon domain-containing protein [Candidatus Helarchaeota archaeon]